ncbi:uncharacterized protein BX664DRAFT_333901 [Halteromyces radiatus]|uniref:uncharacterized protein n=1 Tax=Halteromyces radiatus TaxID=101107 RepID=UPI00221FA784|nr:uncharacterized protein BX664DRAFT_333901 [Halteromyces radiatus]KAI8089794.1 hypothetical protein BX664DRAFT_333901 [Halteromyces radiatus]
MITKHSSDNNMNDNTTITRPRKRTHLTASQIASLQASFNINPLPESAARHGLSLSLGIPERTVQIWFQNRRAKARKMEALGIKSSSGIKSNTPGGSMTSDVTIAPTSLLPTPPRYQATFRTMMTPEIFEEMNAGNIQTTSTTSSSSSSSTFNGNRRRPRSASKPEQPKPSEIKLAPRAMSEEMDQQHLDYSSSSYSNPPTLPITTPSRTLTTIQSDIVSLPVHLLRIGTWTRLASHVSPIKDDEFGLVCYFTKDQLIWQIETQGQKFRIQIPKDAIHQLTFGNIMDDNGTTQVNIHLDPQQLVFSMCLQHQDEWVRCGDFSEKKQISQLFIHELQGQHDALQQALLEMMSIVPDLASKLVFMPSPLLDELCRDFTISPSATPEPSFAIGDPTTMMYPNHFALDKSMMLQAPFYYPSPMNDQQYYQPMMML